VAGFSATTPPAIRWRTLAKRKLQEIEAQMSQLERMKVLLESGFRCQCLSIEDCARIIGAAPLPPKAGTAPLPLRARVEKSFPTNTCT